MRTVIRPDIHGIQVVQVTQGKTPISMVNPLNAIPMQETVTVFETAYRSVYEDGILNEIKIAEVRYCALTSDTPSIGRLSS